MITIPPIPWINLAHKNGVEILGTIITEHKEGQLFLESILSDHYKIRQFACSIALIMQQFKFDGWLLNIENELNEQLMPNLVKLVKAINEECKKINFKSIILWYDAINEDGKLKWQNEMNDRNLNFFNSCDGIFLNYNWNVNSLIQSFNLASEMKRRDDVFVGVDVFGSFIYLFVSPLN